MQTQRHFWLKTFGVGSIVLGCVYFFSQPATDTQPALATPVSDIKTSATSSTSAPGQAHHKPAITASGTAPGSAQAITPELEERIATMHQRRPGQQFSPTEVAAAVKRTTTWAATEEVPRELPLKPEEFSDGRQFIELDSLKIETLVPGDQVNVRVDKNAKDYKVVIDRVEKHDYNSISWYGHIQGDDGQKYSVSFTRGEQLMVGGLDTPDGHYVLQAHGNKGWVASSQLLFKADTSVSDAIHPADVDPNYARNQEAQPHNH